MFSYDSRNFRCLCVFVVVICVFCSLAYGEFPEFEFHLIDRIGKQMGQSSLVDVDRDGDLDWITG
ncbi:MAG: hypothetical protein D4R45_04060, partial [Planctomycetaceae bacterium]